jgi:hypothetical protein
MTMTSPTLSPSTVIRESLLNEEPKMDAAIKSFASYLLAGSAASSQKIITWDLNEVLVLSRKLSQQINQHVLTVAMNLSVSRLKLKTESSQSSSESEDPHQLGLEVTAQVWNELVGMKQKPTKSLGRTALMAAWDDLELGKQLADDGNDAWNLKVQAYLDSFYKLLMDVNREAVTSTSDAHLIWDADKGQAELARRAADRQNRAAQAMKYEQEAAAAAAEDSKLPFIEELPPDSEE